MKQVQVYTPTDKWFCHKCGYKEYMPIKVCPKCGTKITHKQIKGRKNQLKELEYINRELSNKSNTDVINMSAQSEETVNKSQAESQKMVARKCTGCKAPLSGKSGELVTCRYCDTEQVL